MATLAANQKQRFSGKLSANQVAGVWMQAGGNKAFAPIMTGISYAESGWAPDACNYDPSRFPKPAGAGQYGGPVNTNSQGALACGLWQINISGNPGLQAKGFSVGNLFDPITNARAAIILAGGNGTGIASNWSETVAAGQSWANSNPVSPSAGGGGFLNQAEGIGSGIVGVGESALGVVPTLASGTAGTVADSLGLSGIGKDILYGMAFLGGGVLIALGALLIGADIGITAYRSVRNSPPAKLGVGISNSLSPSKRGERKESQAMSELEQEHKANLRSNREALGKEKLAQQKAKTSELRAKARVQRQRAKPIKGDIPF